MLSLIYLAALYGEHEAGKQEFAHGLCGGYLSIIHKFAVAYGELPRSQGRMADGSMFTILANDDGYWTILLTSPHGDTCAFASGDNWEYVGE